MVEYRQALPAGFVLAGDYRITGVLGQGGFGITYKADDLRLGAPVAIKEYFPSELAVRDASATVEPRSAPDASVLEWGRARFLDEAKTLARFRHRSIVRVSRLFEANNTAYMVLDFEMGPSLAQWRGGRTAAISEADLDPIVRRLLDAVDAVHAAGILHRDIKPANIIMRGDADPVLIDFGAARQALSAQSRTVHAIVTPGYSPKEQYAVDLDRQGPWSDIYALGATLYFLVSGRAPPDALSRELGEDMPPAASMAGAWSLHFLSAIDRAMSVDAAARPQSTTEWREMLFPPVATVVHVVPGNGVEPSAASATTVVAGPAQVSVSSGPRRLEFDDVPVPGEPPKAGGRQRSFAVGSIVAGMAAVAGLGFWVFFGAPARDDAAWQRATAQGTGAAYELYLREQPRGRYVAEARQRRAALEAPAAVAAAGSVPFAGAAASSQGTPVASAQRVPDDLQTVMPGPAGEGAGETSAKAASSAASPASAPKPTSPAQVASRDPVPAQPTPPSPAPQSASTVPARASAIRSRLPDRIPDGELQSLAASVPAAGWRLIPINFDAANMPGFSDQATDFVDELTRLGTGKLKLTVSSGDRTVPEADGLGRLTTDRDVMAWRAPLSDAGRGLEFAVMSGAVPFGLDPISHVRWLRDDGARFLEQSYDDAGAALRVIPCGIAGGVGAWFRQEVRSPSNFRGLQVRAPRIMADALEKLGARSVTLASDRDLAAAFAGKRLDANFGVTPLTQIFLAQSRPAPVYHYPGVHNPAYLFTLQMGRQTWAAMASPQQRLVDEACRRNLDRWAQHFASTQSDVLNDIRRRRITVRPFTGPIREALRAAVDRVLAEEAARNPRLKDVLDSYNRYRI